MVCLEVMLTAAATILPSANPDTVRAGILNQLGCTQPVCSLPDLPPVGTYSTSMLSSRLAPSWDRHRPCTAALTGEGCGGPDEDLSVASGAGSVPPPPQILRPGAGSHAQQVSTGVMKLCLCLFMVCVYSSKIYVLLI